MDHNRHVHEDNQQHATIVSSGTCFDMEDALLTLKVRLLRTEVMDTLLYGSAARNLGQGHFADLRTAHKNLLLTDIGFQRQQRTDHDISTAKTLSTM